jgi:hypothetical protein
VWITHHTPHGAIHEDRSLVVKIQRTLAKDSIRLDTT